MELTVTNSPFGLTIKFYCGYRVVATPCGTRGGNRVVSAQRRRCARFKRTPSIFKKIFDPVRTGVSPLCERFQEIDFWVTIARGSHPFPSRTRKLSLSAPMVLHARVCGRVGSCPDKKKRPSESWAVFVLGDHSVPGSTRSHPGARKLSGFLEVAPAQRRRRRDAPMVLHARSAAEEKRVCGSDLDRKRLANPS